MRPPHCDFRAIPGQPAQRERDPFEDPKDCDIIIEAVVEDLAVKNQMWQTLDAVCGPETIFASITSSLTIATDMTAAPFVQMHALSTKG